MTYKTVLAVLSKPEDAKRMFDYIGPLAAKWESHVIGVHSEPSPAIFATPEGFPDASYLDLAMKKCHERAVACKEAAEAALKPHGLQIEWRSYENESGDNAKSALASAYRSDLIVAMQRNPEAELDTFTRVETLLFDSGRPVLLVPYAGRPPKAIDKAMVAWNGTREASRAVFDALPLLVTTNETEIFIVDPKDTRDQSAPFAGSELAATLSRHGVNVTVRIERSVDVSIAAMIENRVAETNTDLLVMGAYGHSRLREFIFGGATRTILQSMPALTLMAH